MDAGKSKLKEAAERMCEKRGGALGVVMAQPREWNVVCEDQSTFSVSESLAFAGIKNGELYVVAGFMPIEAVEE